MSQLGISYVKPSNGKWATNGNEPAHETQVPVKVNSVLSCKSPQDLCRHPRIVVAPKFTGQMGFCPFCGFFSARLCLENQHRDLNGWNFCQNRFFSASTCTLQSSSVSGKYLYWFRKCAIFRNYLQCPAPPVPKPSPNTGTISTYTRAHQPNPTTDTQSTS